MARAGRRARILNVGCGPAREVQDFLKETPLSNQADFMLLDFNEETLHHASAQITEAKRQFSRQTPDRDATGFGVSTSAPERAPEPTGRGPGYDLIYCGGLFDYLCRNHLPGADGSLVRFAAPGGLVLIANMNDTKPFRNFIEFVLDWQLIYRDSRRNAGARPRARCREAARVIAEPTSVNLFLHLRKPD